MDPFGNKRVDVLLENFVARPATVVDAPPGTPPLPELPLLYFGIPANDQLEQYWTTVEGRLFQIRHCMNLAGQVRQLPPFAPPIDPAVLVRAIAAGVDLDSVLAPPRPPPARTASARWWVRRSKCAPRCGRWASR
ncbi:hypothetical protein BZL29_1015 [Mycobacterium kansasii]|uniref:Uncharacterized protein n=1 Tax=Mycobacterium kansasii TaxID=1768 RepID=A0A1V3XV67_MYCKA|nr:hypothetical protein BZL29_1015 [Mycobacterium kansasii]